MRDSKNVSWERLERIFVGFTGRVRLSLLEDAFDEKDAKVVDTLLMIRAET